MPIWRFACLSVLLVGCGGGSGDPAGDEIIAHACTGVELRLGTGVREYQAVVDGDTVYLYRGPQGGYMVYISVQARGLDPSDDEVCYTETFSDGAQFGTGCWRVRLGNDIGDGWFERIGIWGQVDTSYWTKPAAIRGKDAAFHVTVTDKNGCMVEGGWVVHISSDPGV